jgi:hypothetical protein
MPDEELRVGLKQAKQKKMFFAFVPKGTDGKLIVSKRKIPPKDIADAKKEIGGSAAVLGKCFGEEGAMVFEVAKAVAPTLTAAVKKVAKRETGLTLQPEFRVVSEADLETAEETEVVAPAVAPTAREAPPPVEEPDEPSTPPTEKEMAVLEDRRRDFKKARAAWVAVKAQAEEDLEKVKDGAHMEYVADADQLPKIVKGCKDIDDILDNLDDELRDTLDQYASTPLKNQAKLHRLAATATKILDRYLGYVESNPVLKAIDAKEFADVAIYAPIKRALDGLRKALV